MEAGGSQGAAIRLSEEFISRGYDAETWFLYRKSDTYARHSSSTFFFDRKPNGIFEYCKLMTMAYRALKQKRPDVVILYTHYANIIGATLSRLAGVKTVIATHRSKIELYPVIIRIMDALFGIAGIYDRIIFVSPVVKKSFRHFPARYFRNSKIITNGIDKTRCKENHHWLRQQYGLPIDKFLCISTGRLISYKNQRFLIDLMRELNNNRIFLLLAGDGEDREFLQQYITQKNILNVKLMGEVPPEHIRCLLELSDLFLFASRTESFGFAVLEAMSAGLPVICTDIEAMKYVVGDSGFLIPENSRDKWIKTLNQLMNDRALYVQYCEKAVQRSNHFTLGKMADEYERLFLKT